MPNYGGSKMKTSFFTKLLSFMAQPTAVPKNKTAEIDKLTTDDAIAEVSSAVDAVEDVINNIYNLAAQIKLLSKNAAIESARAREYGKGFMVFSSELEALAEGTSKNAKAISNSLQGITTQIENAELAGHDSLCNLAGMQKEVEVFADAFSDIPHTTASLSDGTSQIANTAQDPRSVSNTF
jgi:methyl-accepting chemotaxis protein